jgi:hypothetical protein
MSCARADPNEDRGFKQPFCTTGVRHAVSPALPEADSSLWAPHQDSPVPGTRVSLLAFESSFSNGVLDPFWGHMS